MSLALEIMSLASLLKDGNRVLILGYLSIFQLMWIQFYLISNNTQLFSNEFTILLPHWKLLPYSKVCHFGRNSTSKCMAIEPQSPILHNGPSSWSEHTAFSCCLWQCHLAFYARHVHRLLILELKHILLLSHQCNWCSLHAFVFRLKDQRSFWIQHNNIRSFGHCQS